MLRGMTTEQLWEWVAFSELEPFEPERLDQVISNVSRAILTVNRKRGSRTLRLDEVTPSFGDHRWIRPRMSWQEMERFAEQFTRRHNRREEQQKRRQKSRGKKKA